MDGFNRAVLGVARQQLCHHQSRDWCSAQIKSPAEAGLFGSTEAQNDRGSERTATSIAPREAAGANAAGPHHDNRRGHNAGGDHDNTAAIRLAAAIRSAMKARAASTRGVRRAEARK